jgi:hypothetical protein
MANSEDYIDVAIVREMLNKRPFSVCWMLINQFDVNVAVKVQWVTMFRTNENSNLQQMVDCFEEKSLSSRK